MGTVGPEGAPALPDAVEASKRLAVDLSRYRARVLRHGSLANADLVLGFEPSHLVLAVVEGEAPPGRAFLLAELVRLLEGVVAADGSVAYLSDPAVNGKVGEEDDGTDRKGNKFDAPKTQLIALIINGILDRELPWDLVLIGVLIAVTLELAGVPALPFAVGVYLPLSSSMPIFVGGMVRWFVDRVRRTAPGDEGDTSPGVLLSSGYIAGGSIAAVLVAFFAFHQPILDALSLSKSGGLERMFGKEWGESDLAVTAAFAVLVLILAAVGSERFGRRNGNGGV